MLAKSALNYALSSSLYATNEPQIAVLNNNRLDFLGLCAWQWVSIANLNINRLNQGFNFNMLALVYD